MKNLGSPHLRMRAFFFSLQLKEIAVTREERVKRKYEEEIK